MANGLGGFHDIQPVFVSQNANLPKIISATGCKTSTGEKNIRGGGS